MHGKPTFSRFVSITAAATNLSADEAEARIDPEKLEAVCEAAFGGQDKLDLYPDLVEQGTLCCFEFIQQRPLPCDNKWVGYDCLLDVLSNRRGAPLDPPRKEIEAKLDGVGNGSVDFEALFAWVRYELGKAEVRQYERRPRA
jgi:hypothetical protein